MTTREADKAIKSGSEVTLHNPRYNETFTAVIVARDKWTITTAAGGRFERDELEIVS